MVLLGVGIGAVVTTEKNDTTVVTAVAYVYDAFCRGQLTHQRRCSCVGSRQRARDPGFCSAKGQTLSGAATGPCDAEQGLTRGEAAPSLASAATHRFLGQLTEPWVMRR